MKDEDVSELMISPFDVISCDDTSVINNYSPLLISEPNKKKMKRHIIKSICELLLIIEFDEDQLIKILSIFKDDDDNANFAYKKHHQKVILMITQILIKKGNIIDDKLDENDQKILLSEFESNSKLFVHDFLNYSLSLYTIIFESPKMTM